MGGNLISSAQVGYCEDIRSIASCVSPTIGFKRCLSQVSGAGSLTMAWCRSNMSALVRLTRTKPTKTKCLVTLKPWIHGRTFYFVWQETTKYQIRITKTIKLIIKYLVFVLCLIECKPKRICKSFHLQHLLFDSKIGHANLDLAVA